MDSVGQFQRKFFDFTLTKALKCFSSFPLLVHHVLPVLHLFCSRSGLLSKEFFQAGVYHFSDHNRNEAAEYIGTVIVKPKQMEHYVELTKEGFTPGEGVKLIKFEIILVAHGFTRNKFSLR